jgi:hypothetical protein
MGWLVSSFNVAASTPLPRSRQLAGTTVGHAARRKNMFTSLFSDSQAGNDHHGINSRYFLFKRPQLNNENTIQ